MLLILNDTCTRADTSTGAAGNTTSVGDGWVDVAGGCGQIASNQIKINSPNYLNAPIMRPGTETEVSPRVIAACVIDSAGCSAMVRFGDDGSGNGAIAWVSGGSLHVGFLLGSSTVNDAVTAAVSVTNGSTYFLQCDLAVSGGTATATAKLFAGTNFLDAPSVSVLVSSGGAAATALGTATTSDTSSSLLSPGHVGLASINAPSLVSRVVIGDAAGGGSPSFVLSPTTGTTGASATVTATGTNTAWTTGTTFSVTGGTGASISGLSVNAGTQVATFTLHYGTAAGTLTVHDATDSATAAVTVSASASFALSPATATAGTNVSVTATGTNTAWTTGTTFSVTGGTGASISGLSVNAGTQVATFTLTPGTAAGTLTVADSIDAATATVAVSSPPSLAFTTPASVAANDSTGVTISATLANGTPAYSVGLYRSASAPFTPPGSGTLAASYSGSSGSISLKDTAPGSGPVFYRLYATDAASGTATTAQSASQGAILARQKLAPWFTAVIGDSINYGYGGSGTTAAQYAQQALAKAHPLQPIALSNDSSVGSNSGQWAGFYASAKSVFDAAIAGMSPAPVRKFMRFRIGTNDAKPGTATTPSAYSSNVAAVANLAVADGYTLILDAPLWVDPAGSITGWDEASNALILQYRDQLAALDNGTTVRAGWLLGPEFFAANVSLLGDGTHPNDAGYQALGAAEAVEFERIAYGSAGGPYPSAADVRLGTATGSGSTGTLHVPAAAQVLAGVAVDATTGTVTLPTAAQVEGGVTFGPGGGTTGTAPSPSSVAAAVWAYGNRTVTA